MLKVDTAAAPQIAPRIATPPAPARTAIEARELVKTFGAGVRALDRVSVAIRQNEFFTLLGPSGCGKTTLLRLIAGFEQPTSGALLLDGRDIAGLPPHKRPINTVFQSYALFPHLTVAQNVAFGLEMLRRPKKEIAETVDKMLALVKMTKMADRRTAQISGGQQQRVALARALAPRPRVLLLDEPLSALDLKLRKEMQVELKRLQHETGITFVFVTHDQDEALTMSDRIAVMSEGHILQVGAPRDIYDHPADRFVASFIGDTNFLRADVTAREPGRVQLTLSGGVSAEGALPEGFSPGSTVTVAIRPEHLTLTPDGASGAMGGYLRDVVFSGPETLFHVALDSGEMVVAVLQNQRETPPPFEAGARLGVALRGTQVQVLRD
ncbi:MAG: ABC transporter ATP-binding protein [Rhodobacteraceae bacterium]|nr:MAG: ABC transporter ATP-binding protein [Paracoccaceae bacterium]